MSHVFGRLRGYQLPASGPGQPPRHPKVYGRLDEKMQEFEESPITTPDTGVDELQERGFAEKESS